MNKSELAVAYKGQKANIKEEKNMKAPAQKQPAEVNEATQAFETAQEAKPTVNVPSLKKNVVNDNSTWYLGREDDLAVVTAESSNPEIGVEMLRVFAPREDQLKYNTVMTVAINLSVGVELRDISVRINESGNLYLNFPFSMIRGKDGQNNRYHDSIRLPRLITAQVLSFAHECIDWDSAE